MLGTRRNDAPADDARARIRELFAAADDAKAVRLAGEERVAKLKQKAADLEAALPALQEVLKKAEYEWRLALGRQEAGEASAEDVAAAEKGIDAAQDAIDQNRAALAGVEHLLSEARNRVPGLVFRAEHSLETAWRAVAELLEPDVRAAAQTLRRHYVATLNSGHRFGMSDAIYLQRTIGLGDVAAIAVELENEYR